MVIRSFVAGCGSALPETKITNEELSKFVNTSDAWIQERTGIKQRYRAKESGEYSSDLATKAAILALEHAEMTADELDFIIVGTASPDLTFPSVGTIVQANLGMKKGFAFDVQAACSGFLFALATADNFIKVGQAKAGLVIGAEIITRLLDWEDRSTCVLFGDGAGAFVLKAGEGNGTSKDSGILSTHLHSDGSKKELLKADGGVGTTQTPGRLVMNGPEVFRHAVVNLAQVVEEALASNKIDSQEVDWLVPHQANLRIIEAMGKKLKLSPEQVVITIDQHANTSSASIPLAFDVAVKDGRIKRGDLVLCEAMGGGFTWASSLFRY